MKVKVTPVERTPVQYVLPQTAEARAVRAELREMDAYWFYDNDADEYVRVPAADELA
jgi:hypothetical protein